MKLLALLVSVAALAAPMKNAPAFTFTCTTTAQRIKPPSGRADYSGIWVWNNSTTPVYFGDSTVDTTGMPLCTDTASCPRADQSYDVQNLSCKSSSGSVTINVQIARTP